MHHYHKDGPMRFFSAKTGNVDAFYEPNSFNGAAQDERFAEPPLPISGDASVVQSVRCRPEGSPVP